MCVLAPSWPSPPLPHHKTRHQQKKGELWKPKSRIPYDWSFAGYRQGAVSVPSPAATHNVKNFGAKGDGVTDDTAAVLKALETMPRGVLLFPAGLSSLCCCCLCVVGVRAFARLVPTTSSQPPHTNIHTHPKQN